MIDSTNETIIQDAQYKDVDTLVEAGVVYNKEASPGVEMPPPRLK